MEKLLVAQALDQRDFLKKKINDQIKKAQYCFVCKEKDEKINGKKISDIEDDIKSSWQSIHDMIDRYNRINRAIIQSNAVTEIEFKNGTKMTKAEAIALKKSIKNEDDFSEQIIKEASRQFQRSIMVAEKIDIEQQKTREGFINSMLNGTDKKNLDQDAVNSIEATVAPFGSKWINPLDIEAKITEEKNKLDEFNSEVETLIKVSNATTYIEF